MSSSPYGPMQPVVDTISRIPRRALQAATHPADEVNALLAKMGLNLPGVAPANQPPPVYQADPGMVREANESFRQPDVTQMKKPLPKGK